MGSLKESNGRLSTSNLGGQEDFAAPVQLDGGPGRTFEVRYHFPSREAFETYERDHASALRAEGLRLFPTEKGVTYRRCTGHVVPA